MDSAPPAGFVIFVVLLLLRLLMAALRDHEATELAIEQERARHGSTGGGQDASYACVPDGRGELRGVLKTGA